MADNLSWTDNARDYYDDRLNHFDNLLYTMTEANALHNNRRDVSHADVERAYEKLIPPPEIRRKNAFKKYFSDFLIIIGSIFIGVGIKIGFEKEPQLLHLIGSTVLGVLLLISAYVIKALDE